MHLYSEKVNPANENCDKMPSVEVDDSFRRQEPGNVKPRRLRCRLRAATSRQKSNNNQQQQQQRACSCPVSDNTYITEETDNAASQAQRSCLENQTCSQTQYTDASDYTNPAFRTGGSKLLIHHHRQSVKNRFHLMRTLGEGTYGKVKLAVDKGSGEHVAVKYIKKTKIPGENDKTRIRREIQILSSLKHKHIVNIREVFEKKDKIVIVLDYAPGGELYDYLDKMGTLSEPEARRIFRQIVSAVHYCHQNDIVHRDLKLENIILDQEGNVKMADFGLSNFYSCSSLLTTFCGSPLYASPEIVNGKPYQGPEVDIWSLGVMLYTLVYGSMPFESSNMATLRDMISRGDYTEPAEPSDAAGLIRHMLTVTPSRRAIMNDILHHWWVNLGYSCMPNDKPYNPDQDLSTNVSPLITNRRTLPSSEFAYDSSHGSISSDSDVELDFNPNSRSNRTSSLDNTSDSSASSMSIPRFSSPTSNINSLYENTNTPIIPDSLLKLPQDVLQILKTCSRKTLALISSEKTSFSSFDTASNYCCNSRIVHQTSEEDNKSNTSKSSQTSLSVSDSEKKPIRGILKRKGKFSGGDSGCVMHEDMMLRMDDLTIQESNHFADVPSSMIVKSKDVFSEIYGTDKLMCYASRRFRHGNCRTNIANCARSSNSTDSLSSQSPHQQTSTPPLDHRKRP